jgi:predicted HD superfamily hydrolase involved in NAD metabolism
MFDWSSNMDLHDIRKKLKKELDKERYEHTKGVMYTAGCLAMAYEYSIDKAMLAGLLHDCAKCIPNDEKIRICKQKNVLITQAEYENPTLLHAKVGAIFAEDKYEVHDPEILHAIKVHTTGEPDMNLLDKMIYVADYIEPKRDKAPHLEYIRKLAFENLDQCIAEILYDTLHFLSGKKGTIDPTTQMTFEFYRQYQKEHTWKH